MDRLQANSALSGLLPVAHGRAQLNEITLPELCAIAPFKGRSEELNAALDEALGMALPQPGRSQRKNGLELVWFSQSHVMLFGPRPEGLERAAALTDQSDAWCAAELSGPDAEAVLARLVPVDLRGARFKRGHCLRSTLGHLPLHLTRIGPERFRVMSYRSMAGSLVHDLACAMRQLAARG